MLTSEKELQDKQLHIDNSFRELCAREEKLRQDECIIKRREVAISKDIALLEGQRTRLKIAEDRVVSMLASVDTSLQSDEGQSVDATVESGEDRENGDEIDSYIASLKLRIRK